MMKNFIRPVVPAIAGGVAFVLAAAAISAGCGGSSAESDKLASSLAYLNDVEEIAWMDIEGNNVYLGFTKTPSDLRPFVHAVALAGNQATGFGVHVWAVVGEKGWRPGQPGLLCESTARYEQIESECTGPVR
jgi:hypothetical protein